MSKYSVVSLQDKEVTSFLSMQPDFPMWTHPDVCKLFGGTEYWGVKKGNEVILVWPVFRGGSATPPLCYYYGPTWSGKHLDVHPSSRVIDAAQAYAAIIHHLIEKYGRVKASLSPSLTDVRGLIWPTSHLSERAFVPRFTAVLDLRADSADLLAGLRKDRRKWLRRFAASDYVICHECRPDEVLRLYAEMHARKAINGPSDPQIPEITNLLDRAIDVPWSFVGIRSPTTHELLSFQLALDGKMTRNAVIQATSDAGREIGAATVVQWESILQAKQMGLSFFDFNGANSLTGAEEKHSFGAVPQLYFEISLAG